MSRPTKSPDAGIQPWRPLDADTKRQLVEAVAEHYTLSAATRAVLGDDARYPAVVAAAKNDIEFGLAIERARERHRDNIRATVRKLALGYERPLAYQGRLTGDSITEHDIEALKILCRTRLPEFTDKRTEQNVNIHGSITVDDAAANSRWVIGLDDLVHLDETDKRQLAAIIKKVQAGRNALSAEREFDPIADSSSGAIEAEFEELQAVDPSDTRELAQMLK